MSAEHEGPPSEIELAVALGVIEDSTAERWQLRLLNAMGQEVARVRGVLAGPDWTEEASESFAELSVSEGGLSVSVKIALDPETRCTVSPDGTMTGTLPSGATWITTPLLVEDGRR